MVVLFEDRVASLFGSLVSHAFQLFAISDTLRSKSDRLFAVFKSQVFAVFLVYSIHGNVSIGDESV